MPILDQTTSVSVNTVVSGKCWKSLQRKNLYFYKKADMTFEKTYEVQKDNRLIIKLPERFKSKKRVKVIIEDVDESRQEKIKLL